jgi:hypothetical protein
MKETLTDAIVEQARRERVVEINLEPGSREDLEQRYGKVWNTSEMSEEFTVTGFAAPFAVVRRKRDSQVGSLEFQHSPRFYFNFVEDKK